jgi:hypothetical protein
MLHMETESEVIRKIRYQVDNYDEQQESLQGSEDLYQEEPNLQQHTKLCAPDTNRTTIGIYSITLCQRHGITDLLESLPLFLENNNLSTEIDSYKVSLSNVLISHAN